MLSISPQGFSRTGIPIMTIYKLSQRTILTCAMDSGLDSDCIDSIATAICDFVVKHRDELPCEMDMFQPDPLF